MSILGNIFGNGNQSAGLSSPQAITSGGGYSNNYMYNPYSGLSTISTGIYTQPLSLFDVAGQKASLENQLVTKKNVEKQIDLINNLAPETIDLLKLFDTIKTSSKLEDIELIDKWVKNKLFSNKLDAIINE